MHQENNERVQRLNEAGYQPSELWGCGKSGKSEIVSEK